MTRTYALMALTGVVSGWAAPAMAQPYGPAAEWTRYYNGPVWRQDVGYAVAVGPDGRSAIVGSSEGLGTDEDMAVVVYDSAGNELWARRYNNPAQNYIDRGVDVGFDSAGNVYVTGISWGGLRPQGGEYDYITIKYSPSGQELWARRYNGQGNWSDTVTGMVVDGAGNCYLSGFVFKEPDQFNRYATHFHILKYDPQGEIAWEHQLTGANHLGAGARAIHLGADGYIYATGVVNGGDPWNNDNNILTARVHPDGTLVYAEQFSSGGFNSGHDDAWVITSDAAGNAYVGGVYMESEPLLDEHINTLVLKYSPSGQVLEQWQLRLERGDEPEAMAVDAAGNVYVAGDWGNQTDDDGYIAAFSPGSPSPRWIYIADEPEFWDTQGMIGLALGPDGNIYAAGDIQRSTGYDPVVYVLDAAGNLLTKTPYDFGSDSDYLFDFAMAANGDMFLAGARPATITLFDFALTKVPGAGGPPACFANCDASTAEPVLNVADFSCFLQKYAAADPYANCDQSTTPPVLNVADFSCFLQKFAAGCR
jgi:hypothetical protein